MAHLQDVPFRPACVVSSLPKRFRESLTRDLDGSVSISTCPLNELETTVEQQCATLAVVGVSGSSLDIAERLSHNQSNVKVFLAHYNNAIDGNAPKNGFAGVFDLRAESKRLADSIRESIAKGPQNHPSMIRRVVARHSINLIARFIEMHERVSNPAALMESMLETFLELTGSSEALLLTPSDLPKGLFVVEAVRGEESIPLQSKVVLKKRWLSALQKGDTCIGQEELHLSSLSTLSIPPYSMAAPIVKDGQLCAVLTGNSTTDSEALHQFIESLPYLFRQLSRRKSQVEKELLLNKARLMAGANWMLVDGNNRVIHYEGQGIFDLAKDGRVELHPRLRDLIHRALLGEFGEVLFQNKIIGYQPFHLHHQTLAILRSQGADVARCSRPHAPISRELLRAVIRSTVGAVAEHPIYHELIDSIFLSTRDKFDIKQLEPFGITQATASSEIQGPITSWLCLALLVAKGLLQCNLTASYFSTADQWYLTVETPDEKASLTAIDLTQNPIFQFVVQLAKPGNICLRKSIYGFQLSGSLNMTTDLKRPSRAFSI